MIVYHGTTSRRARQICAEGFLPRKPSRRVWFAKGKAYAEARARTQARRSHDRPVVLICDIDLSQVRARLGAKRVFQRSGNIAIGGPVPATVLRSHPGHDGPTSPEGLAVWINDLLGVKAHKGVGRRHPAIQRLGRWIARRLTHQPDSRINPMEVLQMARQWLPEFFEGVEIDPQTLRAGGRLKTVEVKVELSLEREDPREEEALECLADDRPKRRTRGLELLAEIDDPDLFDWCAMYLTDPAPKVCVAALRMMLLCEPADAEVILPLARSSDRNIRAAAIAALTRHSGKDAARWFERGLKDPTPCVRRQTAAMLKDLDPAENKKIFELALYDPNPDVAHLAEKVTVGKGFAKLSFRHEAE